MSTASATPLDHPSPVAASWGICYLIASISLSNSPRTSTELRIVYRCMKDTNLYKIVIEVGMILFLKRQSYFYSAILSSTPPPKEKTAHY
jgi:hypothetical protein